MSSPLKRPKPWTLIVAEMTNCGASRLKQHYDFIHVTFSIHVRRKLISSVPVRKFERLPPGFSHPFDLAAVSFSHVYDNNFTCFRDQQTRTNIYSVRAWPSSWRDYFVFLAWQAHWNLSLFFQGKKIEFFDIIFQREGHTSSFSCNSTLTRLAYSWTKLFHLARKRISLQ